MTAEDDSLKTHNANTFYSSSPLNGEAAELWDQDTEEFQRKVTARHRDIEDE